MAASFEPRYMQQGSVSDGDQSSIDEDSAGSSSNLLKSVQEQELQFSRLTQEIEEEKRAVQKQLDMEEYTANQPSYEDSEGYNPDVYITHSEQYGEPEEETTILVDDDGNQKTINTRTVTKTVTEQRFHQVEQPMNNHKSAPSDSNESAYATIERDQDRPTEHESLLNENSSNSSNGGNEYMGGGDNLHDSVISNTRQENARRQTPEKFQPETYGLEDDNQSDYGGEEPDQYGYDAAPIAYQADLKRGSSISSNSVASQRYHENEAGLPDELPVAAPRVGRAPLAEQEMGSRASLDGVGNDWQTPSLEEVVKMLAYNIKVVQINAAAFIQHLCFNNDDVKTRVRELGGIPLLVRLLDHPGPVVQLNSCAALRNLSFGPNNTENKLAIKQCEGVPAIVRLVRSTDDLTTREQATGTLWNLSAHPTLEGQLLELAVEPLLNQVIIPYAASLAEKSKADNVQMVDLFTHAVGVLRNLSSTNSFENRRRLREQPDLIRSLFTVLRVNLETGDVMSQLTENCICILRNFTYRLREDLAACTENDMTMPIDRPTAEQPKGSSFMCFGKPKPKVTQPDYADQIPPNDIDAEGSDLLYQPEATQIYCKLLHDTQASSPITEATLGALQNITSGRWQYAAYARAIIRKEKGLPDIIARMRTDRDQIIRAGTIALSNCAEDNKNKDLIGKFAMKDLVYKLPGGNDPNVHHSDTTVIAVLNTIRVLVTQSPENVKYLRDNAGLERITTMNKKDNNPLQLRVQKAAGQLLETIWKNKEKHSMLKKDGWNKGHFQPNVTAATLPRSNNTGAAGTASPSVTSTGGRRAQRTTPSAYNTMRSTTSTAQPAASTTHADSWV